MSVTLGRGTRRARAFGLTLDELITIYRVQFPVLRQNESDTYFDINGRIVFTSSKGLVGVGHLRKAIRGHGHGWIFSTKDFFDCGNRYAVNMALHRLKEKGMIRQILRGIYDYPKFSKLFNDLATPDPYKVTSVIANSFGWSISPSGETALNLLGLSTQVPAKLRYFSDGPSKKYLWGGMELEFTHRAIKETNELSPRTALVVQALKALGKQHVDDTIIAALRKKLTKKELQKALQETRVATNWIYDTLKRVAEEEISDG